MVKAALGQRRKTLLNALSGSGELALSASLLKQVLTTAGIEQKRRAETLSLSEFAGLARVMFKVKL